MIGMSNRCPSKSASLRGCISHLVEQRYYRQSVIDVLDNFLQAVFQDCIFGGGFCVGSSFVCIEFSDNVFIVRWIFLH